MSHAIRAESLRKLVDLWLAEGKRVIGPRQVKPGTVLYADLAGGEELLLAGAERPANSIKEAVFPRHEPLYRYRFEGKQVQLLELPEPRQEQIVLAARPCDAAALAILDQVFNWDVRDERYNRRRQLTTVVSLACAEPDAYCFCTSVGLGPDDPRGSDAMLADQGDGLLEVRLLSDKGQRLLGGHVQASDRTAPRAPPPRNGFDLAAVRARLADGFQRPEWAEWALRCLGCGACAYSCPTCHCFDMVDEGNAAGGLRVRNWDACQFPLFTLHASGHNPRASQWQRQRQRIYHKFQTYPEKFGETLCTGCGNCARNCPVGLGVLSMLRAIESAP